MRFLYGCLLALLLVAPVQGQENWREFRSDSDGFSVSLPQTPTVTARRIGTSEATQSMFLVEIGETVYLVSVIQLAKGAGPKNPDNAYLQNLLNNYAEGSKTTLRSSSSTTVAGRPGMEGVGQAEGSMHIVNVTVSGDRIYMLVFVGPPGQEKGEASTRFRSSFKLL